jgi:hypothetical protein
MVTGGCSLGRSYVVSRGRSGQVREEQRYR